MKRFPAFSMVVAVVVVAGCASTQPVDMKEPRRVMGTADDVRVDAEIYGEKMSSAQAIALKYDVTNSRTSTILIADLIPMATYDSETRVVTVDIGTEVPGNQFLPRLIPIGPGEKKSFATSARMGVIMPSFSSNPGARFPNALRIRVNFLGDTKPFEKLIAIPEKAVHDPELADKLFTAWLERNETLVTNPLPMTWDVVNAFPMEPSAAPVPTRRRRG